MGLRAHLPGRKPHMVPTGRPFRSGRGDAYRHLPARGAHPGLASAGPCPGRPGLVVEWRRRAPDSYPVDPLPDRSNGRQPAGRSLARLATRRRVPLRLASSADTMRPASRRSPSRHRCSVAGVITAIAFGATFALGFFALDQDFFGRSVTGIVTMMIFGFPLALILTAWWRTAEVVADGVRWLRDWRSGNHALAQRILDTGEAFMEGTGACGTPSSGPRPPPTGPRPTSSPCARGSTGRGNGYRRAGRNPRARPKA